MSVYELMTKNNIPWTTKEIDLMREMREAGYDFEEISEATGHPTESCRTKAGNLGIRKYGRKSLEHHTGITDDGPELGHRNNGRPKSKPLVRRQCIQRTCRKWFMSWDITKNQRCPRCDSLGENSVFFG
jgi:hypothetical protein